MLNKKSLRKESGVTLIELVIVLAIMGILLAVIAPVAMDAKKVKVEKEKEAYERELAMELRQYYLEKGSKPFYEEVGVKIYVEPSDSFEEINDNPESIFVALNTGNRFHFKEEYDYKYSRTGLFGEIEVRKK